jgi:hypothetical protein
MLLWLSILLLFQNAEVPFKPTNEFDVKIDIQIKTHTSRESGSTYTAYAVGEDKKATGVSPYLTMKINLLKLSEQEVKAKVLNKSGQVLFSKKVKPGISFKLDIGFIEEIKDGSTPADFLILLSGPDKKETSRIQIRVGMDGTYSVNGLLYGRF